MALAQLLDVESEWQDRELQEHSSIAVDPRGINPVEAAFAGDVQLLMELHTGDFQLAQGYERQAQEQQSATEQLHTVRLHFVFRWQHRERVRPDSRILHFSTKF